MLEKILSERLNVDVSTITDESHIVDDLGADSLSVVEIVMDIESEYEVQIPDEDAETLFTVAEIKQWIEDNS
ncbi:MAG: acyl carrier protein [Synechococcus sp. CPC35]|jgi:acyl carrier protein|nr:acyl carrier protein [Synechococcus sp. CPC35]